MLKNGAFVKEAPPTIGRCYIPEFKIENVTPEERFMQDLLLSDANKDKNFIEKLFDVFTRKHIGEVTW
jgi:hypothetical protein